MNLGEVLSGLCSVWHRSGLIPDWFAHGINPDNLLMGAQLPQGRRHETGDLVP